MQRGDFHTVIVTYFPDRDLPGRIDNILRRFERLSLWIMLLPRSPSP